MADRGEPSIVTAPGEAPEAKYAAIEARNRALDAITHPVATGPTCRDCGDQHPISFRWRGVERGWHELLPDPPRPRSTWRGRR